MSPRKPRQQSIAVVLAVSGFLLLIRIFVSVEPLQDALAPIARLGSWARFDAPTAGSEDTALTPELAIENKALREVLELPVRESRPIVRAEVLSKNVQTYRQTIRIDRGRDDGVQVDAAVLIEGRLIGRVRSVSAKTADVILLGDPDFRAAAVIEGTTSEGIVRTDAGSLVLDRVSRSTLSDDAQTVITSGLGGVFPPGLPLGELGQELSDNDDIFARYALKRSETLSTLRVVEVVVREDQ